MKILDVETYNNNNILKVISDTLFNKQLIKTFHIDKKINLNESFFYYGKSYLISDYVLLNLYSVDTFISLINKFRDMFGILLGIEFGNFRIIASDEELEFIFNNQNRKPIYPESYIKGNFTYES